MFDSAREYLRQTRSSKRDVCSLKNICTFLATPVRTAAVLLRQVLIELEAN